MDIFRCIHAYAQYVRNVRKYVLSVLSFEFGTHLKGFQFFSKGK